MAYPTVVRTAAQTVYAAAPPSGAALGEVPRMPDSPQAAAGEHSLGFGCDPPDDADWPDEFGFEGSVGLQGLDPVVEPDFDQSEFFGIDGIML